MDAENKPVDAVENLALIREFAKQRMADAEATLGITIADGEKYQAAFTLASMTELLVMLDNPDALRKRMARTAAGTDGGEQILCDSTLGTPLMPRGGRRRRRGEDG